MSVKDLEATDLSETGQEAHRVMTICNACRYCEGFCAVFPAMALRRDFEKQDLDYLANLCHNCNACYHACQYAPPHEFAVNVPKTFATLRAETYAEYAWPRPMAKLFERNGLVMSMVTALSITLVMLLVFALQSSEVLFGEHIGPGAFYQVISHNLMVAVAGSVFLYSILAMAIGFVRFWRAGHRAKPAPIVHPIFDAIADAASLKYLGGGHGEGCNTEDESFSNQRRWFHQFTMWGFILCFAATSVATLYDYLLGLPAPYPFFSLPVMLGTIGGIGLLIGPVGLFWIKLKSDPVPLQQQQFGMDYGFIALLFFTSFTGLVLLALRETSMMGTLLALHLGFVLALFLVLPYSKFVHAVYRFAALMRFSLERSD
ncbi:MAG: tricarballylate utilization 4Fe-4S protein TcuB [Pseudomonadota bacterium]